MLARSSCGRFSDLDGLVMIVFRKHKGRRVSSITRPSSNQHLVFSCSCIHKRGGHERPDQKNLYSCCPDLTNVSLPGNDFLDDVVAYGDVQNPLECRATGYRSGRNRRILRWECQLARPVTELCEALRARCSLSDGDCVKSSNIAVD